MQGKIKSVTTTIIENLAEETRISRYPQRATRAPALSKQKQMLLADACMRSRSLDGVMSASMSVYQVRTWPQPAVRGSCAHTIKGEVESGGGELEPDRPQEMVPRMAGLHHDARRRTAVMSVNSDAVGDQSSQALERSSHHVVCRLTAAWPYGRTARLRGAWGFGSITLPSSSGSILGKGLVPQGEIVLVATICNINIYISQALLVVVS